MTSVPPEAVEAAAKAMTGFGLDEAIGIGRRDAIRLASRALAAAAPHIQRQAAAEVALRIASVATDIAARSNSSYSEIHRQLMAACGYVPAPSDERSSDDV